MGKIEINHDFKLIVFNAGEDFSPESLKEYIDFLFYNDANTASYQRITDLSNIKSTRLKSSDFDNMASLLKDFRFETPDNKTCFYCKNPEIEKLANYFIEKMKPEFINFFASTKLNECAEFLDLELPVLEMLIN